MNAKALASSMAVLLLVGLSSAFVPTSSRGALKAVKTLDDRLFARSQEERDWLEEMESQSYDSLRENKEPLYDHDDWVYHRSSDRRLNEAFDLLFPLLASFVLWFLWAAIRM